MKVIVLGAGLLGVTSAYFLRQHGHDVTVIDRRAPPTAETSFANGGQISVGHAEPWVDPGAPLKLLKWLGKEDAPLLFRLRSDMRQWLWGLQFLHECTPARTRCNIEQIVRLGAYSRQTLGQLRRELGIDYDERAQGILHFYTSRKEFDAAEAPAAQMRARLRPARHLGRRGSAHRACAAPRPASAGWRDLHRRGRIGRCEPLRTRAGQALHCRRGAVPDEPYCHGAARGRRSDRPCEVSDAEGRFQRLRADAYVVALGSVSPLLVRPLGVALPIYPVKGYSVTMPVKDASMAFKVSLTDDEYQLVLSRLDDRLRIAGTAELNGYDRVLNSVRCEAIVRRVEELFPGAGDARWAQF